MSSTKRVVSVQQLLKLFPLSESTIRRRLKGGALPAIQPGGPRTRWLILLDELLDVSAWSCANRHCEADLPAPQQTSASNLAGPEPKWLQSLGGTVRK